MRLSGGAEMFMRRASIPKADIVTHKANEPIDNKNVNNPKKTSVFAYDIFKDRRYSMDQYEIHIPIAINKVPKNSINDSQINYAVRKCLQKDNNTYIIGIDRGERNLLYIVVIDGNGHIVEQMSLNQIVNEYDGIKISTDYHDLLDRKEKERLRARQAWKTIENIKELKEGYLSQVIHKICELVVKYDAVIALEDLNSGFKNSRVKVEKQVYQKFEKMLIDKLNYMTSKQVDRYSFGGVLKGYQLARKFTSFKTMGTQNGFIFYIPAWLTSKIDPTTGFVNLLRTKYTSIEESRKFISSFDSIKYISSEDMFAFEIDYDKFERTEADFKKKWTIYTNGDRIRTFRNSEKNNEFDYERINLREKFVSLFETYNINYRGGDLRGEMCSISQKEFYVSFLSLLSLTLQMRNSITGTDTDYIISPVKNSTGRFYCSDDGIESLPENADANGAYNIARKVLWAIEQFKQSDEDHLQKVKIAISNKQWLEFAQKKE